MIPWVRTKYAERRARWLATRKETSPPPSTSENSPTSSGRPQSGGGGGQVEETHLPEIGRGAVAAAPRALSHFSFDSSHTNRFSPSLVSEQCHHIPSTSLASRFLHLTDQAAPAKPSNLIRISVLGADGQQLNLVVPADIQVERVKIECIFLFEQIGTPGHASNYKLFTTSNHTQLGDSKTLDQVGVVHKDELYLVRMSGRAPVPLSPLLGYQLTYPHLLEQWGDPLSPDRSDLDSLTNEILDRADRALLNHLDPIIDYPIIDYPDLSTADNVNNDMVANDDPIDDLPTANIEELVLQSEVQHDIRQILISLCEASAYIIGVGEPAQRLIALLKLKLVRKRLGDARDGAEQLIGMGFDGEKVTEALRMHDDNYSDALCWLIDHGQEHGFEDHSPLSDIAALLAIVRIYCQSGVPPPDDMVQIIKGMGFAEPDVVEALKITKNNYTAACDWLIGNRATMKLHERPNGTAVKANGLDGLPSDSPILLALLSSPIVQLSLSNPTLFLAYLAILEDYTSMSMWLGDGETSGTISHILRTYHEEKHILAINGAVK